MTAPVAYIGDPEVLAGHIRAEAARLVADPTVVPEERANELLNALSNQGFFRALEALTIAVVQLAEAED